MKKAKSISSILKKATLNGTLARVSLKKVVRRTLIGSISDFTYPGFFLKTTFAHQFGRHGYLDRIQSLLLPKDYDLEIRKNINDEWEPPLYAFVGTEKGISLMPSTIFTKERLFRRFDMAENTMWIRSLISRKLVHLIPMDCFSKEALLTPYDPPYSKSNPFIDMVISGQASRFYPEIISTSDIISCIPFKEIVREICHSEFPIVLNPIEFAPYHQELFDNWDIKNDTKEARDWMAKVRKYRLKGSRLKK